MTVATKDTDIDTIQDIYTVIRDKFKLLPGGTRKREFALYRIKISPAKKVPDSLE